MRLLRSIPLLLILLTPHAFADQLYNIELILFRQGQQPLTSGQTAPDDWAQGANRLDSLAPSTPRLDSEVSKLNNASDYQVLLHKAWQQPVSSSTSRVAISEGDSHFEHATIEGTLSLQHSRLLDVEADFWVNQIDESGAVSQSEHIKQSTRLKNGELTYLDHGSLGILIKASPM